MNITTLRRNKWHLLVALFAVVFALTIVPQFASAADGIVPVLAQNAPAGQQPAQAPNIVQPRRSYIVDAVIVVIFFGGAIFAVVRSSRRA